MMDKNKIFPVLLGINFLGWGPRQTHTHRMLNYALEGVVLQQSFCVLFIKECESQKETKEMSSTIPSFPFMEVFIVLKYSVFIAH